MNGHGVFPARTNDSLRSAPEDRAAPSTPAEPGAAGAEADSLQISLSKLLCQLPEELQSKKAASAANLKVRIEREPVLDQLAKGAVRIPFGSIRRAVPAGIFINSSSHDNRLIELPLGDVLAQLPPEHFACRRHGQKTVAAPPEVGDLFEREGAQRQPVRVVRNIVKEPALPPRQPLLPGSAPRQPVSEAKPAVGGQPLTGAEGRGMGRAINLRESSPPCPRSAGLEELLRRRPTAPPADEPRTTAPIINYQPATLNKPELAGAESLSIPLAAVSEQWAEPLRRLIGQYLTGAVLRLPFEVLERRLKLGVVSFTWKELCQWIDDCPAQALASMEIDARLDLPLSVVAPLYLRHRPRQRKHGLALTGEVPDVFRMSSTDDRQPLCLQKEEPLAARPNANPGDAGAGAAAVKEEAIRMAQPPSEPKQESPLAMPDERGSACPAPPAPEAVVAPRNLAEVFGEPHKRNWTPNEIVQRTCELPGVSGAIMALQDGLLVASCLPPDWRADMVTAFLPQIFCRMNQYCRELGLGELRDMAFTVERGTVQVFKAGLVYYAVLGEPGNLPWTQLRLIVSELNRHTQ